MARNKRDEVKTQVLIIGGGVTGAGLARDLALRGVDSLLAEKGDINAGASGGNHGLLHSGARYVGTDPAAALECVEEGEILKKTAPQCVEESGGLFVAVAGDDEDYPVRFPELCQRSGVWTRGLDPDLARGLEPALSSSLVAAFEVRDGVVDPFRLSFDNLAQAQALGARVRTGWEAVSMRSRGGRITRVGFRDHLRGGEVEVRPDLVINAAGAWAGQVAGLAGLELSILYSKGTLVVTQSRLTDRVINRLRPPSDADILVPGGTVSVAGTTSSRIDSPDRVRPSIQEVDRIIDGVRAMLPVLEETRFIRAYTGVRPLVSTGDGDDDRRVSRDFSLVDHAREGLENILTIAGGKLTTHRLMAEKAADLACKKLGIDRPCLTRTEPLPPSSLGRWTEPGSAPISMMDLQEHEDPVLCECELVAGSTLDSILDDLDDLEGRNLLHALGLRSRMGKGPCQGCFCGLRVTAHLFDRGFFRGGSGVSQLKSFVERRWRGFRPVLWGSALVQAELQEALLCGFLDLELTAPDPAEGFGESRTG